MSDVFREVDEEVQRDKMLEFFKKFGPYIAIIVGIFLIVYAGWRYWSGQQEDLHREQSKAFAEASALFDQAQYADAVEAFSKLADEAGGGYGLLARLNEASALTAAGNMEQAAALYDAVAASADDELLRSFASLHAAFNLMDTAAPDELRSRLRPLAVPGGPWFYSATEALGFVDFKAGDIESARINFSTIAFDTAAPQTLRGRAQQMLAILGEDATGNIQQQENTGETGDEAAAGNPDGGDAQGDSSQ